MFEFDEIPQTSYVNTMNQYEDLDNGHQQPFEYDILAPQIEQQIPESPEVNSDKELG